MIDVNFIPQLLQGTSYGIALDLAIIVAIACWLLSVITREYSWVDRIWSVCPGIYPPRLISPSIRAGI